MIRRYCLLACAATLPLAHVSRGQDVDKPVTPSTATTSPTLLEPLTVVGSTEQAWTLSGSAAYIGADEFRERGYTNFSKVVAKTPGIYVRDEDSYGNFLNISIRGVDGNRSNKVTLMEDGILTAPSPYSNPSAYYSPKVGRMAGVEILKGSSQVKYGPQTTGGVVNFLSTPIPEGDGPRFFSRNTFGTDNTFFNHMWSGDTVETESGRFGYLLELHHQSSDGFRELDGSGATAGMDLLEPMLKFFWEPNTALKQRFEVKVGYTDFDMDDSYPGVTEQDLRANYDRRYAGNAFDTFDSDATRSYFKWIAEPSDSLRLESALYYNEFNRAFFRLNDVRLGANDAIGGGTNIPIASALLNPAALAVLQGYGDGTIRRLSNIRFHESYGWQNQANIRFETGSLEHDLALGARVHYDSVTGEGQDVRLRSNGNGGFYEVSRAAGRTPNALEETTAIATFIEDEIKLGQLTIRPGFRYEFIDWENTTPAGVSRSGDEHLVMGGVGLNYLLDDCNSIFAGIYRGSSPPNTAGYMSGADAETSLGYEIGYRHQQEAFRAEVVGFYTAFDDLITPQIGVSTGNVLPDQNVGEATSYGLETLVEYDAGEAAGWGFGVPVYASATYTHARFDVPAGQRLTGGLFAGAVDDNEIPYIPEWRLAVGVGITGEKWAVNLDASYMSSTWGTGWNGTTPTGIPSAVNGKIDSLVLVDLTGHYRVNDNLKLVGGVQNLFDERGLVSRHPQGPRGNAGQTLFGGVEVTF
ncbi:TonB-dependent receptor [Luteolibacter flavescens]|uniref:TonB-dependent receptor n=1 Tax=Luteolibacter flavescens TaxID=1859460 RepID=A0ABT3FI01_9BACT|nr:TonB-dependent receptor [Luteolibacter flavescens]MCW1883196.1 TonB-dependent receptor [Luteolibacter flavescens]